MFDRALVGKHAAWLLASHRQRAGLTVTGFAREMRVYRSTVHTWEHGRSTPSIEVIRRYESISGHDLLATLDVAHRAAFGAIGGPVIRRPAVTAVQYRQRTLDLVDKADGDNTMTGSDWDELTGLISADPLILLRDRDAEMLTHRLAVELCAAEGDGWARRQEALARLVGHPTLGRIAIDTCDQLARDREFAGGGEVLLGLDGSTHRDATTVVLRHLREPVSVEVEAGARVVAAQKIRLGHIRGRAAPELARRSAPPGPERVAWAEQLAQAAAADVGLETGAAAGLVIAMLHDPDATARYVAIRMLAASPLRAPLAHRIGDELARPLGAVDGVRAVSALAAFGGSRRPVERLACAPAVSSPVRAAAVRSLGHMRGDSPPGLWRHLVAQRVGGVDLVYALGMRRQKALLESVAADPEWSPSTRASAAWWLRYTPTAGPLDH